MKDMSRALHRDRNRGEHTMTLTQLARSTRMRRPDRKRSAGRVDARPNARGMRRTPEPFRPSGRAFRFRVRRILSRTDTCHDQDSDHQRHSLHQWRQASRQSRRLAAAGGRACALPPPDRRRRAVHLRHRRARHAGRARRHRGRPGRARLLRRAARASRPTSIAASACRSITSAARPRRRTTR